MSELTKGQAENIGKMCRDADDGNLVIGSFAAELVDESYPFSKAMSKIVFDTYSDEALGRKFAEWCDKDVPPHRAGGGG